jgi:uncharacterized protein YgiB involved in biofilm formation
LLTADARENHRRRVPRFATPPALERDPFCGRCVRRTSTLAGASLPIALRTSARTGSLWVPAAAR